MASAAHRDASRAYFRLTVPTIPGACAHGLRDGESALKLPAAARLMAVVWVKPDGSSRELLHGCISFAACVFDLSEDRACMRLSSSWVVASSAGASRKPYEFILLGTLNRARSPVYRGAILGNRCAALQISISRSANG